MLEPFRARSRHEFVCGVYRIHCLPTGEDYVGASTNIKTRMQSHRNRLKNRCHGNRRLQELHDAHGHEAFRIEILEECESDVAHEAETRWHRAFRETLINVAAPAPIGTRRSPVVFIDHPLSRRRFYELAIASDEPDACWGWSGTQFRDGYPVQGDRIASRFSYFLHTGEQPGDKVVRHTCDNKLCTNPRHLVLGTHADNQRDKSLRRGYCTWTDGEIRDIRGRWAAGEPMKSIVASYGGRSVRGICHNIHHPDPDYHPPARKSRGPYKPRMGASMSWEKARLIREMATAGSKSGEIARALKVPQSTVCRVVGGYSWVGDAAA